ncbi:MAG: diguanylate cyclase [Burkholderiaceae bacterium]
MSHSFPSHSSVKRGVRYRLAWLVLACVLPMLALVAFTVADQYRHARSELIQKSILTARAMALTVDKDMGSVTAGLYALASSNRLQSGNFAAFHQQATDLLDELNASNIYLIDRSGQLLLHTRHPYGTALPATGNPAIVERVFATGTSAVSDLFIGSVAKKPLVSVVVPVWKGNEVIYALSAAIHPDRLSKIFVSQGLPEDWVAAVFDGSGRFIVRSRGIDHLLGKTGAPEILEKLKLSREGWVEHGTVDNTLVIGVFSKSQVSNWTIAIGIPKAQLTAELWRRVILVAVVTFFILLITIALAWKLGGKIARAIQSLIDPAMALGRNEQVMVNPSYLKETDEVGKAIERAADILLHTRHKAYHDPLTGLANRALFGEIVEQQLALCRRYGEHLTILYMDLDGFKSVNDTHGHAVGDLLLRQVAARLQAEMRRSDLVARLGGDEFAAVLMNTDLAGAKTVAAKLVDMLSAPYQVESISLTTVSASIGVAVYPEAGKELETLMQRADYAMYLAKKAGKRQYAVAESEILTGAEADAAETDISSTHADKAAY